MQRRGTTPLGDLTTEYDGGRHGPPEIDEDDATATGATARVHRGMVLVQASNTGHACESGRLLEITIVGTFPDMVTTGFPGAEPEGMVITAVVHHGRRRDRRGLPAARARRRPGRAPTSADVVLDLDDRPLADLSG